jgi:hypothetical protein
MIILFGSRPTKLGMIAKEKQLSTRFGVLLYYDKFCSYIYARRFEQNTQYESAVEIQRHYLSLSLYITPYGALVSKKGLYGMSGSMGYCLLFCRSCYKIPMSPLQFLSGFYLVWGLITGSSASLHNRLCYFTLSLSLQGFIVRNKY